MNGKRSDQLIADVAGCTKCPRMSCSTRVLSDRNGNWDAEVMVVAEAPGRFGADRTGVPLFGDRTGDRFEALLSVMSWSRSALFITNAVLCNPRDEDGNNDRPSTKEIRTCSTFLRRSIELIQPSVVLALGQVALSALSNIEPHDASLKRNVGRTIGWFGRMLAVLYHPAPRTVVHRPWKTQLSDAKRLARSLRRIPKLWDQRMNARTEAKTPRFANS